LRIGFICRTRHTAPIRRQLRIQRNWRKTPGHVELAQGSNYTRERETGKVTVTRYVCERCGTNWEYENDKKNQHAGWSLTGRRATKN